MDDKNRGLYGKFIVERTDGRSAPGEKHENCEYFVLDLTHDPFALSALDAYAEACEEKYPALAKDLRGKVLTIATQRP
jgi:hypothetical protein